MHRPQAKSGLLSQILSRGLRRGMQLRLRSWPWAIPATISAAPICRWCCPNLFTIWRSTASHRTRRRYGLALSPQSARWLTRWASLSPVPWPIWGPGGATFLGGMAGSILFTIVFALSGGFPLFTMAWIGNRLFQSQGWAGLVRVSSRWFSYSTYGSVMAVVSLSFLFGDAGVRWTLSELMAHGVGWRGVFFFSAASLAVLLTSICCFCARRRGSAGLPAPQVNPRNLYALEKPGVAGERAIIVSILRPLLTSFAFWMVCLLGFGMTLLRESFNLWTPTYFVQFVGLSGSAAASHSALFPLCGGVSVLLGGFLSDKLGANGRNVLVVTGMTGCTACLVLLGRLPSHGSQWAPTILVGLVGFMLLGPYSYLSGAMSLDFGGERGSATAAGIIDGFGYMAGWLSGDTVARISVAFGWKDAFLALAGISLLTAMVALVLTAHQRNHTVQRA